MPQGLHPSLVQPRWMDFALQSALNDRNLDYPRVALRVCEFLSPEEVLGLRELPTSFEDPQPFGDSWALLNLCKAAMMAATFRSEVGVFDQTAFQRAVEAVIMVVRQHAFTHGTTTIHSLMDLILWDIAGRMSLEPADRASYAYAVKATLYAEVASVDKGSDNFTFLMQQAEAYFHDGLGHEDITRELNELACMLYHGIAEADFRARKTAETERARATQLTAHLDMFAIAEELGVDLDRARALQDDEENTQIDVLA